MVLFGCFISSAVGSAVAARSAWTSWTGSVFTCGKPMGFTQYVEKNKDFSSNVWMSGCHSMFGQQQNCLITDVLLQKMVSFEFSGIRHSNFHDKSTINQHFQYMLNYQRVTHMRTMVLVYLPT